jgi:putative ABC transport system permease protein
VAILLVVFLQQHAILINLIEVDLSLTANLPIVFVVALVAIIVGALAGLYPSRYMTSFAPALALKGNWGLSPKGKKIRNTLIGIQYIGTC